MQELQTFLKDKAYDFVPLLDKCKRLSYIPHNIMEKGSYNGKLKLKIQVLSPLHIGGRMQDYDNMGNIIKKQVSRNGNMVIPGSSLKGAVRSIAEAVSYSCAVKVPDNILKRILPINNQEQCSNINNGICIVCSIFGIANGEAAYKGKVNFGEFKLISGGLEENQIPLLEKPFKNDTTNDVFYNNNEKKNYGNERLYYCKACETGRCQNCSKEEYSQNIKEAGKERDMAFRGRKFYKTNGGNEAPPNKKVCCEMIRTGSVMEGELIFQNLRKEEGMLLAYALDINNYFTMKLGYAKSLGYGKVRIYLEEVESASNRYPGSGYLEKEIIENWGREYRERCSDEIKNVINKLEEIMK
ncbi:MAG: hypothetical protein HFH67_00675 [Lachnospiraceae bacterium]|nr:hypothetical protein [Lachnospiraceae bacterium]